MQEFLYPVTGICKVTLTHKGIHSGCCLFVVPRNGLELLGMPECERLQLLNIYCNKIESGHKRRQVNEQCKENKSTRNKNVKLHLPLCGKDQEKMTLLQGQKKKATWHKCQNNGRTVQPIQWCLFRHWMFQKHTFVTVQERSKTY